MISRDIQLTDGEIILRPPTLLDAPQMFAAVRESIAEIKPWLPWCHDDYAIDDTNWWLNYVPGAWEADTDYAFLVLDAADYTVLGGCGLNQINRQYQFGNLGYWVRTSASGRGVAARATRLVAEFGFHQLELARLEIVVDVDNIKSGRVAEKVNAVREGVMRNRITYPDHISDAVMYSLIPSDFKSAK